MFSEVTRTTISESQLMTMVMFNLMTKKESKSNSTINTNSGAHTLTHDQIIKKSLFNKNRVG